MVRRILVLLLVLILCFGAVGCSGEESSSDSSSTESPSETSSVAGVDTSSKESLKEMYMEALKKSEVFKQYDADDWRSHAYDYKLIALTFDDGPVFSVADDNNVTQRIVDILVENDGRGTFFFTGRSLKQNGFALPQYALDNGFEVANHSYNHASLKEADYETAVFEIVGVNDLYVENIGVAPKYFRGGGFTTGTNMWKVLGEQDMIAIASLRGGSGDHAGGSATVDGLVTRLSPEKVSDGEIVCMHSTNKTGVTPDALAVVLPRLYAEGYRFCTLSELFAFKGVDLKDVPRGEYIKKVEIGDNGMVIFN
ncbi:MAG: polysaccharide deacetylase family protein [Clostridia bacterium]|nr:polysaccharide deacetylase family protein [Clostridia bacterium]